MCAPQKRKKKKSYSKVLVFAGGFEKGFLLWCIALGCFLPPILWGDSRRAHQNNLDSILVVDVLRLGRGICRMAWCIYFSVALIRLQNFWSFGPPKSLSSNMGCLYRAVRDSVLPPGVAFKLLQKKLYKYF